MGVKQSDCPSYPPGTEKFAVGDGPEIWLIYADRAFFNMVIQHTKFLIYQNNVSIFKQQRIAPKSANLAGGCGDFSGYFPAETHWGKMTNSHNKMVKGGCWDIPAFIVGCSGFYVVV